MTELPDDFETFFMQLRRKHGQTLQDYQGEFTKVERKLEATHSVKLPEKVRAWWFLRRRVSREQRQLILTHVGAENLDMDKVQKAMNFILGQDSKPDGKLPYRRENVYNVSEPYFDDDEEGDWDDLTYDADGVLDYEETFWADGEDYGEGVAEEDYGAVYDVEEYDEVFAAYADAKAKMNQMRVSRGFYPVVATVERPSSPGKGKASSSSPKKGKNKKGKGKTKQGQVTPREAPRRQEDRQR